MSVFVQRIGIDWGEHAVRVYRAESDDYKAYTQEELFSTFLRSLSAKESRRLSVRSFSALYGDGVIVQRQLFARYLRFLFMTSDVRVFPFTRLEVTIALPTHTSKSTKQLFARTLEDIGISKVTFVSSALSSAIGAGFQYPFAQFCLVVHLGDSNSEVAGLSFQECLFARALDFSGVAFRQRVASAVFARFALKLSATRLAQIWAQSGALMRHPHTAQELQDLSTLCHLPLEQLEVVTAEVSQAARRMVVQLESVLESLSVEEISSVTAQGIVVTGGLGKQSDLLRFLTTSLTIPFYAASDSPECVIRGVAYLMKQS